MSDLSENNLVRFKNVTRKKESMYANFKVTGIRAGVTFSASIAVDIAAAEVHPGDTLEKIIDEVIKNNQENFAKCVAGDEKLFGFFVGQVMKQSKGQANPQLVNEILKSKIK
jgi:Asp-tRNA(Asn)/Glu-tRNA(Gln) amidotransferase B subunit